MPRPATGTIESHTWKDGETVSWRLRVRFHGVRHRVDLGTNHEGWNEERAQVELDKVNEQIRRGTWRPPEIETVIKRGPDSAETLHVTASRWWVRKEVDVAENTAADYRWRLDYVLGYEPHQATGEINVRWVNGFRDWLRAQVNARGKKLSNRSINMVLDCLAQILDDAIEDELLEQNPARGKRRRLKVEKARRTFLDPDMVVDLLDAASDWERELRDRKREDQCYGQRALLAMLCLAGLRIGEATEGRRRDLDIHGGRVRVPDAKTAAGHRDVELTAFLLDELRPHLAASTGRLRVDAGPDLPTFPTANGKPLNASNVRNRLLAGVVERANEKRKGEGRILLPEKVGPHALRRTFASLALTAGRDPRWVMAQMGHTDARLTLTVYAQVMQRERVDQELVQKLMRFHDEEEVASGRSKAHAR